MSKEQAKKQLFELQMERGELDKYMAQFQQLTELAGYYKQTRMICNWYFQGLPKGLREAMIGVKPIKHYQNLADWIKGVIRQHSKYLTYQAYFGPKRSTNQKFPNNQWPSKQQWQQGFVKNPNAMDLTPGHTHAWAALTDNERATLHQEGKFFKCCKKGHMSWDCPDWTSQARSGQTKERTISEEAPEAQESKIMQISTQELVDLVCNMDQKKKG